MMVHDKYEELRPFICSIPERFDKEGKVLYDGRNIIKSYLINGLQVIVKKYKNPFFFQRIIYTWFKASKAHRAYDYAQKFRERGINTPQEIAYIELKERGLFQKSYFVSLACNDSSLEIDVDNVEERHLKLLDALAVELVKMHSQGVFHGDLNLSNILYRHTLKDTYCFTFIDINRSYFGRSTFQRCMKNLMRLTHRTDIFGYIVRHYAKCRGWNETRCLMYAFLKLYKFERSRRLKKRLKKIF